MALRGRLASGILKRIGLQELVAQSEEEYIALVVKLVRDIEYSRHIRKHIVTTRGILFEDNKPIRAMEEFIVAASAEARARRRVGV